MSEAFADIVLDGSEVCSNPIAHEPVARLLVHHHVVPESWGGAAGEQVLVCPTCHGNVHVLIDQYVHAFLGAGLTEPPWSVREHFSPFIRDLAKRAWAARPTPPTYTL